MRPRFDFRCDGRRGFHGSSTAAAYCPTKRALMADGIALDTLEPPIG
jgi:hypothetical protein